MTDLFIQGYASRFGERDLAGDIVRPGAFSASLLARPGPRPMLYGHDADAPIGVWDRLVEDDTGLWVEGRLQRGTPTADRVAALVASGAVSGLSIGYRTERARALGPEGNGRARALGDTKGRELLALDLWEVSVVAFPMLPTARLTLTPTTTPKRIAA